jgi:rSAM/selenodomain-associated transferase 1
MPCHEILYPAGKMRAPPKCNALGIMTKVPQAGKVKTRLAPPLTPDEAAALNICFLRDLAQSIAQASKHSPAKGVGIFTPAGAEKAYENILTDDFFLIPQRGQNFGDRLIAATEDLFTAGFESVCLINSDSPTVPAANFADAVVELARPGDRVVIGPSDDGGYYLIGLKKLHRRIFEEIDWSTERVFAQTKQRAAEIGVEVCELGAGFDVDDRETLGRLCHELLGSKSTEDVAPNTKKFLSEIIAREGRERIWPR